MSMRMRQLGFEFKLGIGTHPKGWDGRALCDLSSPAS